MTGLKILQPGLITGKRMSKRKQILTHIEALEDIKSIINAMKNLALMEISKVNRILDTQAQVVASLQAVAADFFYFHSDLLHYISSFGSKAYILVGSERGFCGNSNERIIQQWQADLGVRSSQNFPLITVGEKLASKLEKFNQNAINLSGPNATEEIKPVLLTLTKTLAAKYQESHGEVQPGNWTVVYNELIEDKLTTKIVQPFVNLNIQTEPKYTVPPLLTMNPERFLLEFLDQYLYAFLYLIFCQSFLAENTQRLTHMQGAVDWIDEKKRNLDLQKNELRQEEIIEEIENILQSGQPGVGLGEVGVAE